MKSDQDPIVAVIGLGYVGLPLAVEFARHRRTIGFDIHEGKVASCRVGRDPSRELSDAQMAEATHAVYTSDPALLGEADIRGGCAHPGRRGPHP